MKTLKKIARFAGLIALWVISIGFIEIVLSLNAKWMTWAFWISLGVWLVTSSIRDGIKWYRKRMKPMVKKVNEAMDATGLTSRESEH